MRPERTTEKKAQNRTTKVTKMSQVYCGIMEYKDRSRTRVPA